MLGKLHSLYQTGFRRFQVSRGWPLISSGEGSRRCYACIVGFSFAACRALANDGLSGGVGRDVYLAFMKGRE